MWHIPFICVIICLKFVPLKCCDITPIVTVEMTKMFGFHRELRYTVQFDYKFVEKDCEYYLEQTLPAAVYINVDQLNELSRLEKLKAIYPKYVDVEITAENAKPIIVLVNRLVRAKDAFQLPIHFRYHAPSSKSSFVTVTIDNPLVYVRCSKRSVIEIEVEDTFVDSYCLDDNQFTLKTLSNDEIIGCDWKLIATDVHLYSSLRASIPIGNKNLYHIVLYATIIITWMASIWIVWRTNEIPRKINQKLEEHRILQKKLD